MSPSRPAGPGPQPWLQALRRPRTIVLGLVVLLIAIACLRLGMWQFDRSGIRAEDEAANRNAELAAAQEVPIDDVLAPQETFETKHVGRRVELDGHFDAEQQFAVPGRDIDEQGAVLVVTAFHVDGGEHDGAIMPVLRGWLPEAEVMAPKLEGGGTPQEIDVPEPPQGSTTIVGMLSSSEAAGSEVLAEGQREAISAGELANEWGTPIYSSYLVLEDPTPQQLRLAPSPVEEMDAGINIQSLGYAVEWWFFAVFAIVFWAKVYRDDKRDVTRRQGGTSHQLDDEGETVQPEKMQHAAQQ